MLRNHRAITRTARRRIIGETRTSRRDSSFSPPSSSATTTGIQQQHSVPLTTTLPQQGGKSILPLTIVLNPTTKTLLPIIGNVSYLAIASGFLMTDMLDLRVLLIGGYTGLVAFHTLHERPLRIPLRWSGLFVLLNAAAAALLVADRYAPSLNSVQPPLFQDDGEDLYQQHFASMLTRGQCRQLFLLADRQRIPAGTILTKENIPCENMFFLVKGQAHVYHGKTNVGKNNEDIDTTTTTNNNNNLSENNAASSTYSWFSRSNTGSLIRTVAGRVPQPPPHYTHNIATIELGGFINDVAFQQEQQQKPQHREQKQQQQQQQQQPGSVRVGAYGTVVTTEDCDVLVWNTAELQQHLASKPEMDKSMKYCLSHHLVKSLMRQREAAHKRQQEHLFRHLPQLQQQEQQEQEQLSSFS